MRRLRAPLLSTFVMRNGPDSPVFERCVPPQAWRSTPSMSMIRSGAVGRRRRGDGQAADEAGDSRRVAGVDVHAAHLDTAADHVVHAVAEPTQRVVVDLRQVEVHPPGAVGVDLGAGDERARPTLVDERVQDVRVGVQLGDQRAPGGVDTHDDVAGELEPRIVEDVPHQAVDVLDRRDGDDPAGVLQRPGVADLATAAGVERRAVEHHPTGRGLDDGRAVLVEIRLFMAQVDRHGPNLPMRAVAATRAADRQPRARSSGTTTTSPGERRTNRPPTPPSTWR